MTDRALPPPPRAPAAASASSAPGTRRRTALAEVHLALLLGLYAAVLRVLGLRGARGLLGLLGGASAPAGAAPAPSPAAQVRARALRTAVEGRADRLPGRPACLPRALTLATRLRQEGLPAELRLGVRRVGEGLAAHAWVECGGVALEPSEGWAALGRCGAHRASRSGERGSPPGRPAPQQATSERR